MSRTDHDDCEGCVEYRELSRRGFVAGSAAAAAGAWLTPLFPAWLPQVVLAESSAADRDVIVSVFLRGGSDGLTLCVPFLEPDYYAGRRTIAVPPPDGSSPNRSLALDDAFAFPPAMRALLPAYDAGDLLVVHATGSTDPSRSHFDAQRFMEVGKPRDTSVSTGWLGRHLATSTPLRTDAPLRAVGISSGLQKTLVGAPRALPIPNPAQFAIGGSLASREARAGWLSGDYELAPEPIRSSALDALATIELLGAIDFDAYRPADGATYPETAFGRGLRSAAALIKSDVGVEAVQIDRGGWDTHSGQDPLAGSMYVTMLDLAGALGAFHADVIGSGIQNVTVVVLSEFGRNVRENGSAGTDHGRGNVMFAMGRHIRGGRVLVKDWPGLARENLERGQDLRVTLDHRDVLAEIVQNRLGNPNLAAIFPDFTPTFRGVTV